MLQPLGVRRSGSAEHTASGFTPQSPGKFLSFYNLSMKKWFMTVLVEFLPRTIPMMA